MPLSGPEKPTPPWHTDPTPLGRPRPRRKAHNAMPTHTPELTSPELTTIARALALTGAPASLVAKVAMALLTNGAMKW